MIVYICLSLVLTPWRWSTIGKKIYPITSYNPVYTWISPNGKSMMCCPLSREDILVHVKSNEAYTSIEVFDINKNYFYTCT